MSVPLLISSGDGPGECQQAVALAVERLGDEAAALGVTLDADIVPGRDGPKSVTVLLAGKHAEDLAARWIGTILWKAKSNLRPGHKRRNWFIGIFRLPHESKVCAGQIRYETFRAGGPGGQHQNTTDSAVRAICVETGLSTIARDGRSQHRNKTLATERLVQLRAAVVETMNTRNTRKSNLLHHNLERGNPKRVFHGERFREK